MTLIFREIGGVIVVGDNESTSCNGISDSSIAGPITIPKFHEGKKVLEIGQYAFYSCINLREIIIEADLVSINQRAFVYCRSLEQINIPPTVTFIGERAFRMHSSTNHPGTLTITFEGISQLSFVGNQNPSNKHTVIIYFCGFGPIQSGTSFGGVTFFTIYSSSVSNFLDKSTTHGQCPDYSSESYQSDNPSKYFNICLLVHQTLILSFFSNSFLIQ